MRNDQQKKWETYISFDCSSSILLENFICSNASTAVTNKVSYVLKKLP